MFIDIADGGKQLKKREVYAGKVVVGYVTMKEMERCWELLGISETKMQELIDDSASFRSSIDVYDDYSCGTLNIVDAKDVFAKRDRVGFFIRRNLFLVVDIADTDASTRKTLESVISRCTMPNITLEKVIYTFFERLMNADNRTLENMEFQLGEIEEQIIDEEADTDFVREMLDFKKKLLVLRNYYEQIVDIAEELEENENGIFTEEDLRYFALLGNKARRLSGNVQMLRENLVQLREANDAQTDIRLNNVMKVFTVITSIFLPLTLITSWYGMNFKNMPELDWKYGYLYVIALSAAVLGAVILFFKKKKLM